MKKKKKQGKKQVEALEILKPDDTKSMEGIFPKDMRTNETKNEINDIQNGKIKLSKKIENMKQIGMNLIFNKLKQ